MTTPRATQAAIIRAAQAGTPPARIAAELNVKPNIVRLTMSRNRKRGIEIPRFRRTAGSRMPHVQRVVDLAQQRVPPKLIAAQLNLTRNQVTAAISRAREAGTCIPFFPPGRAGKAEGTG